MGIKSIMKANIFIILDINYIKKLFDRKKLIYFPEQRDAAITKIEIKKNSPDWAKETCLAEYKIFFSDGSVRVVRGTSSRKDSKKNVGVVTKFLETRGLRVARILGFFSRLNLLLYEEVAGVPLSVIFQTGDQKEVERVLREAGRWIAKLHGLVPEKILRPAPLLGARDYKRAFKKIVTLTPSLKNYLLSAEEIAFIDKVGREKAALIHNDFYPGNVISASGGIYAIDFDKSGLGHPLMDLATFFGWLDASRVVWRLDFGKNDIRRFQEVFLASYCEDAHLDYLGVRRGLNKFLVKVYLNQAYNYIDMCVRGRKYLSGPDKKDFEKKIGIFLKRAGYYLNQEDFS